MPETTHRLLTLTTQIAAAHVGANAVDTTVVPGLIHAIQRSLADLERSRPGDRATPRRRAKPRPAPSVVADNRTSVSTDHLICLEDGMPARLLKRHLRPAHGLTQEQIDLGAGRGAVEAGVRPPWRGSQQGLDDKALPARTGRPGS
jgi:predicted transcriptional regulator